MARTWRQIALTRTGHILAGTLLLAFVVAQIAALSHGAAHGHDPHEHDGILCDYSASGSRVDAFLAADAPVPPLPGEGRCSPVPDVAQIFDLREFITALSRAPPMIPASDQIN